MSEATTQQQTTEQAINLKKEKVVKGITCPSCNGELDINEGLRSFNCKYCGTLLLTKGESGTLKFYVPRKLKKEEAITKAQNWLSKGMSKAKGLKTSAKIEDAFLVFIPYWRVRADVVGWIFGQEKRTRTSNGRTTTYYVDVERKIQNSFERTYSACDVAELGVKKINLTGDTILPVDFESLQSEGMMFNIIASEKEAFEFAKKNFAAESRNSISLYNVTFEHYDLVRENIDIVYYPLWVIRYSFENRTYQVVVDGEDGTICYGKAPGNNLYRAIIGILSTGAGMFMATFFGLFVLFAVDEKFPFVAFLISFVIGIFLISRGYKKFRYGGEVEEGTGIDDSKKSLGIISKNEFMKTEGFDIAKNVAASVVIGSVISSLMNSKRRF
ncbi:MAG: phage holin family protein [Ignavibacteriae bacterium]|nr:phage holin family protein [Ignavibacteriota bacterium]